MRKILAGPTEQADTGFPGRTTSGSVNQIPAKCIQEGFPGWCDNEFSPQMSGYYKSKGRREYHFFSFTF
jgi:hypothetical protein